MGVQGSKFLRTNLDSFEANSILELELAFNPSLHLDSPNHELSPLMSSCFDYEPIDFLL